MKIHYHSDHLGSASFVTNAEGAVCQHIQYLPFGELFVSQRNCEFDSRYKFTAKELDNETSYTYFGARYYDNDLSVWLSVDPLSDKYPSLSPYCYSADNPVVLVDPNGASINPIYDTDGNFLGTDDKGLQGDAIVMKKSDFKQGMSHEEALSKSTDLNTNNREGAEMKMNIHYSGLKDRPDWDGKLTLSEANEWYRNGNGEPLFVDLSKIDLSGIYSLGEKYVGQVKTINLLLNSSSLNDGLVYGKIALMRYSNHKVRALADRYDFEMHNSMNPLDWGRNAETVIGSKVAGEGTPFEINIYGSATLKPLLPWTK